MDKKILVVDDDERILRLVKVNLKRIGFDVITAKNGLEALDCIAVKKPDLIILDVGLPELNGLRVLKRLREDPATASLPVIMLTASDHVTDVYQGLQAGADVYLTKPYKNDELIDCVQRLLSDQTAP